MKRLDETPSLWLSQQQPLTTWHSWRGKGNTDNERVRVNPNPLISPRTHFEPWKAVGTRGRGAPLLPSNESRIVRRSKRSCWRRVPS